MGGNFCDINLWHLPCHRCPTQDFGNPRSRKSQKRTARSANKTCAFFFNARRWKTRVLSRILDRCSGRIWNIRANGNPHPQTYFGKRSTRAAQLASVSKKPRAPLGSQNKVGEGELSCHKQLSKSLSQNRPDHLYAKRTGFGCSLLQFSPSFRLSENPIFRVFPWTAPRSLGSSAALSLRPNCARFAAPKSPFLLRKKKHLVFFSLNNFAFSPAPAVFFANLRRFLWEWPCAF